MSPLSVPMTVYPREVIKPETAACTATRMPSLQSPPGWSAASAANPSDVAQATSTPAGVSLTRRPGVR